MPTVANNLTCLLSLVLLSLGIWTVSAKFEDTALHNFTTYFEVKEYVLPSFEVKIITDQKFYYIKDPEFRVNIEANYLYGKPLDGMAYVLFSVSRDNEKKTLPNTLRRIPILDGEGSASLKREDIVFVTNPDGTPAHRVPVVAEPGTVRGVTLEDGTIRLTINTRADINSLPITVRHIFFSTLAFN
ncbi:complement C3-like [Pyxicephalus adspersus]|uniref:complement C3-like n=1 Tax=Pyxicephalus adspersus TaxID=30357 RepID=UPI003B5A44F7